ncbi:MULTISPECIES: hypothetical protein [unclassified Acinetobacter]|uniref:hypothetical protein n=1 Tax=unclassified Acinetobacter TaxID=196816 RepID=UPI0029345537|nr:MULTISPECIES: hypothetical protein [unclassified Acinetobacter]WOE30775.1 hypothetical protein QSG84_10420 [Acinetobacter sp. SAAs470]WOE38968.1 hypothetical protein QSG86_04085 [Acinetobacter sp. SAAs474]
MKIWLLISGLLISNIVYADSTRIDFKGAITQPACIMVNPVSQQCEPIARDSEVIKVLNQEKSSITPDDINNFVMNYQSSKAKIELNQSTKNNQMINLLVTYK